MCAEIIGSNEEKRGADPSTPNPCSSGMRPYDMLVILKATHTIQSLSSLEDICGSFEDGRSDGDRLPPCLVLCQSFVVQCMVLSFMRQAEGRTND
jgi:hypothetical protein